MGISHNRMACMARVWELYFGRLGVHINRVWPVLQLKQLKLRKRRQRRRAKQDPEQGAHRGEQKLFLALIKPYHLAKMAESSRHRYLAVFTAHSVRGTSRMRNDCTRPFPGFSYRAQRQVVINAVGNTVHVTTNSFAHDDECVCMWRRTCLHMLFKNEARTCVYTWRMQNFMQGQPGANTSDTLPYITLLSKPFRVLIAIIPSS